MANGHPAVHRRDSLTPRERRWVALAALAPIGVAVVVLVPIAVVTGSGPLDVTVAALVYGGLLGLATGFVAYDRVQARQCPLCSTRNIRGARVCEDCGYDLERRPRFACTEHHAIHLEPGMCDCGRRLQMLAVARGIGPEVRMILRAGGWVVVLLVLVALLLQFLAR